MLYFLSIMIYIMFSAQFPHRLPMNTSWACNVLSVKITEIVIHGSVICLQLRLTSSINKCTIELARLRNICLKWPHFSEFLKLFYFQISDYLLYHMIWLLIKRICSSYMKVWKKKKMKALKVGFFISLLFNKYNEDEFIH